MVASARLPALIRAIVLALLVAALALHASRPPAPVAATAPTTSFSAERAMRHVREVAQRPHPIGSVEEARVRNYLLAELARLGVPAQVQEATGVGTRYQVAGRVHNVIARIPGKSPGGPAVLLMAHYDGVPAGPAAGDDGSGLSVLLETVRALRSGPPLQHDVIALFTDGEEAGLLGAAAFVRESPMAHDVAATLNFDARGTHGHAYMFETGAGNLDLVRVLRGAPDVSGSSLMVTVYRALPNDTDLSELAPLGRPALNFAFADGVERYHTSEDDVAHLDPGSVQQEGAEALAVTRALANGPLPRPTTGDAVFFDFPGLGLVLYPEGASRPFAIVSVLLVAALLFTLRRRERRWIRDLTLGVVATVVSTALAGGAALLAARGMTRIHASLGGTPDYSIVYALAIVLLALTLVAACWALARRWGSAPGIHAGALIVWMALALFVTWRAPGASFLFVWPLIAASVAALLAARTGITGEASLWVSTFIALAMLVPVIFSIGVILLGLTSGGAVPMGVLVSLLAWVIAPQYEAIAGARRWRATLGMLAATLLLFALGAATVRQSVAHPARSVLEYTADADSSGAWLVAPADWVRPGSWTAAALGSSPTLVTPGEHASGTLPEWLARSFGRGVRVMARAVPRIAVTSPKATVISDSIIAGQRHLRLRLVCAPGTQSVSIRTVDGTVLGASVDGRTIDPTRYRRPSPQWELSYEAPPDSGFALALTLPAGEKTTLELIAQTIGIGPVPGVDIPRRPGDVIPVQSGDATIVHRRITL